MTVVLCALAMLGPGCPGARGGHAQAEHARGGQAVLALPTEPRMIGLYLAAKRGWTGRLFDCLDVLWGDRESGWNPRAGYRPGYWHAYGVAQALPPSKMESVGADWRWNAWTQIRWGLGYIAARWGDPCRALANSYAHNFY